MLAERRHQLILRATIRRDLVKLEEGGQPFTEVAEMRVAEKDAIAAHAAAMITDGRSVLLDIGTTAFRLARQLHGRRLTTVVAGELPGKVTA